MAWELFEFFPSSFSHFVGWVFFSFFLFFGGGGGADECLTSYDDT